MKKFLFCLIILLIFQVTIPLQAAEPQFSPRLEKVNGEQYNAVLKIEIPSGLHLYAPGEENGIPVSLDLPATETGVTAGPVNWPQPLLKEYENLGGRLKLYEGQFEVSFPVKRTAQVEKFNVTFHWQACTDTQCFMPMDREFSFLFPVGYQGALDSPENLKKTPISTITEGAQELDAVVIPNSDPVSPDEGIFARAYASHGLLYALLLAFVLGLVSSLTPCVYPMIPITVAFFGTAEEGQAGSRGQRFVHSLIFALGIGLSFAILGGVFTWLGRDLGSIFANVWAAGIISFVLLLFAMASFEFFELRPPSFLMDKVSGPTKRGGFGVFVMGLTLGLVAAPCVGPFAGSLLLFVAALGSIPQGFLLLFVYGLGLGSLFMAVALGVSFLPRAGGWMIQLKQFFGSVILLATVYILQFVMAPWQLALYAGFLLLFTAALLDPFRAPESQGFMAVFLRSWALAALVAGIVLFGWGVASFLPGPSHSGTSVGVAADLSGDWLHDHDEALKLGKETGKPVFLDFYADWCLPCKEMNLIFKDSEVAAELRRFVRAKLDCTTSELVAARLKHDLYQVPYMPYLAFYDGKGNYLKEKSFPGYTDKETFLARLKEIH